jgi:hypothetical protein
MKVNINLFEMNETNPGGRGPSPPGPGAMASGSGGAESRLLKNSDSQPSYYNKS